MVLGTVEWTCDGRATTVDRCVGCSAHVKFGELVEFNVNPILRGSLGLGFDFLGLEVVSGLNLTEERDKLPGREA